MGFATKFLIGSVVVAIASVAHPDGLLYAAMGLTVWAVFSWIWGRRRARSGRVVPILLMVAIPWSIISLLHDGAQSGAIQQDGFVMNSVMAGATTPVLLYGVYIFGLLVLDFVRGVFNSLGDKPSGFASQGAKAPGLLSKFFWF